MLIILYGGISDKANWKHQKMIEGDATCGYREYAKNYGCIIYMTLQSVKEPWEHSIIRPNDVVRFIKRYPDAIVWSVKHNVRKDNEILSSIGNKKVYYSCNSKNMYNNFCDISLVDTEERIRKNARLWFKGKNPEVWKPGKQEREFDYLLIGRRADKNELYFLNNLNKVKEKRKILWIGGKEYEKKIVTNHEVVCTDFISQDEVRKTIPMAKVGILFTELKIEGFPQSFIEMTMNGIPVVYNKNAPRNRFYFHNGNSFVCSKKNMIRAAEVLLVDRDPVRCRKIAVDNYSLEKSYKRILKCIR